MSLQTKHLFLGVGVTSLLNLGNLAIVSPTYALSTNFTTWSAIGDVSTIASQATINSGTTLASNVPTGGGAGSLENFLGVAPNSLNPPPSVSPNSVFGAVDGSAIATSTLTNAGNVLSFNWNFTSDGVDAAFATINSNVFFLSGSSPFTYTFPTTGTYNIGIGVVDVNDPTGVSTLIVTNPQLQSNTSNAVPWEVPGGAAIPVIGGILTLGLLRKFKSNTHQYLR